MLTPIRTVAPADLPVTLAEAKAHCRVDHAEDDILITALIGAAVSYLDGYTGILGRCLVTQTWRADYAGFDDLRLPLWPVASVTSVTYRDAAGTVQTVSAANYQLVRDASGAVILPSPGFTWPVTDETATPVSVTAVYGSAAADVPQAIKHAMLLMIGDWHASRETMASGMQSNMVPMAASVHALLDPYRRIGI
jgi:uncharacterized phiE125 gp8 family phage protein